MLLIRYYFAPCIRDLKRLDGTTRSPIYSYLTSTIHGLKVIRSYHAEKICLTEFFRYLDDNTRASYLFITTNRWAGIRFDWIALSFLTFVTILFMAVYILGKDFSTADVALTFTYSLSLSVIFQWTVRLEYSFKKIFLFKRYAFFF